MQCSSGQTAAPSLVQVFCGPALHFDHILHFDHHLYDGSAVNWAHELPEKQRNERRPMQRDERKRAAQTPPPGGWPAGSTSPSSPQGLEARSRKRARTDSASSPSAESNGTTLGAVVDAQRDIRRVTADSYQGHAPSTYRTWLQGIDPQTAGKPAYTSYIGAKVAQHFETGWGVGVVCCIASDPRLKSMTRTPAPDALRPTKSQPFSIIWEDNTDSVVDLRTLLQIVRTSPRRTSATET